MVSRAKIKPAPYNPRVIDERSDKALRHQLERHGCVAPLVANRRTRHIVGGNQRFRIMTEDLGHEKLPVVWVDLPIEREKELNIALNGISGDWDRRALSALLDELEGFEGFDADMTGLSTLDLARLEDMIEPTADEIEAANTVPDVPAQTRIKRGDLIELGPHRLFCGDATDAEDVKALMGGKKAHLVFTDPPYGVKYTGGRGMAVKVRADAYEDDFTSEEYTELILGALRNAHSVTHERVPLYLWFGSTRIREVLSAIERAGWQERHMLLWIKNTMTATLFSQYKYRHEPCFYGHKRGKSPWWWGPTTETTVWEYARPRRNDAHLAAKPVEIPLRAIRNSSRRGEIVLDLFLGSGTTLVAAEMTGRIGYGTEIDPLFCQLICDRYEQHKGRVAPPEPAREGVAMMASEELRARARTLRTARRKKAWPPVKEVEAWLDGSVCPWPGCSCHNRNRCGAALSQFPSCSFS